MSLQPQHRPTFEEWLEAERASLGPKTEYVAGEVFAMTGASEAHNLVAAAVVRELGNRFKGKPCYVYPSDMKVRIGPADQGAYPDAMAVCGERQFLDAKRDCLINPTLVVEVLSDSTEAYDRGDKFAAYRALPSLEAYLLLSLTRMRAELFVRQGAQWVLSVFDAPDDSIPLDCLDTRLSLVELYDKVELP